MIDEEAIDIIEDRQCLILHDTEYNNALDHAIAAIEERALVRKAVYGWGYGVDCPANDNALLEALWSNFSDNDSTALKRLAGEE